MANTDTMALSRTQINVRPLLLLLGVALAVAAGVTVVLWWQGPNWSLLYGNLADSDANDVVQALQTSGIQYKLDGGSAILVPADKVHEARLKLASQGLPAAKNQGGIDLLSKESSFGVSEFMEGARYQYALESELARTISSMQAVEAARVHLALSQQSAFVHDKHPATASVMLQLRAGKRLAAEQISAIVHLVASSVPDMDADSVTVVDQQGRLLSSPGSAVSAASAERYEAAHRVEDTYVQRIEQLLTPLVGVGGVKAQVTADLDAGATEEAHEQYKPDSAVVRSEQESAQTSHSGATANGGVPGAMTNQPPTGGTAVPATTIAAASGAAAKSAAAATPAPGAGAATPQSESHQSTKNYEIDRTLSYTHEPGGRIKRLTVAVLLDNVRVTGADGKVTQQAISAAQIEDITKLVKSAVGFDEGRGDSVNVVNAAFRADDVQLTPEEMPLWQRPWVMNVVRLVLGALVLVALALGVLRPLIRNLTTTTGVHPALAGPATDTDGAGVSAGAAPAQLSAPPGTTLAYEQQIVQARNLVTQDPKRVAQVVKTWVNEE